MLSEVEQIRLDIAKTSDPGRKEQFSQFFTPAKIAQYMAGLFIPNSIDKCHLLDAGAGIGSLSSAFVERWSSGNLSFKHVSVDAFEIDEQLHPYLNQTLEKYKERLNIDYSIRGKDFIHAAVDTIYGNLFAQPLPRYTHAILNPPYKKIRSDSAHRYALHKAGIETVNLYSAFVALALSLLQDGGQLVAIIPRSFCNGPYYLPFRKYILKRAAIKHLHLFESRKKAFKDDDVLQENVIIMLVRAEQQNDVTITTSTDDSFSDVVTRKVSFNRIVSSRDPDKIIHIPLSEEKIIMERLGAIRSSLEDIGVMVSTGPVIDFRVKEHLRCMPEEDTIPLLYPAHFDGWTVKWPQPKIKKPNAIQRNAATEKWLYPNGFYCIVRRFSSKEEKRRIVASVFHPTHVGDIDAIGFENHLNVFHQHKKGLPELLVRGLVVFLNTTAVDEYFRRFNGHTQVNASDLRRIQYPNREALILLGKWAIGQRIKPSQALLDKQLEQITL